ncbi:hypothetical protein [Microbulbifer taiwanensis]|uniref:hypothetical protein n=1 Tax=Microbulbifer taiwanensis TaxID=986746 RepID=UPI00361D7674
MSYQDLVGAATGLSGSYWRNFNVALLCEAMYKITSNLRKQLDHKRAERDIASYMGTLLSSAMPFYSSLLEQVAGPVKSAFDAIGSASYVAARSAYLSLIQSPPFADAKLAQVASGTWGNGDWEMFHHFAKLKVLGASDADINGVIDYLKGQDVPIPASVDRGRWQCYGRWFGNDISWHDIQADASDGILKEICYVYPGSRWPSCMRESNAYEFTANSQPGNGYREVPSSSCFKAGARVVMADGTLKNIEQVAAGDLVKVPGGSKEVRMLAEPLRLKRQMYSLAGHSFEFSATHPFVLYSAATARQEPYLAAVDPIGLIDTIPTSASLGVVSLGVGRGRQLARYSAEEGLVAADVAGINTDPGLGSETEVLYDLVVDFGSDGLSEYFVGDDRGQYLVSSEFPRFGVAPQTTEALSLMLQGSADEVLAQLAEVPEQDFTDVINLGLSSMATTLLPRVLAAPREHRYQPGLAALPERHFHEALVGMSEAFKNVDGTYNRRYSNYYEGLLAVFGNQISSAISLGWRSLQPVANGDATMLSVSVYSLALDGSLVSVPQHNLALQVQVCRGDARFTQQLPAFQARSNLYHELFDQVLYFSDWRPLAEEGDAPWSFMFHIVDLQTQQRLGCTGAANLPANIDAGFAEQQALILDEQGQLLGQLGYDLRQLSDALFVAEQKARAQWTADRQAAFAQSLGAAAGAFLKENLPNAAKLLSQIGSVQSSGLFPPVNPPQ